MGLCSWCGHNSVWHGRGECAGNPDDGPSRARCHCPVERGSLLMYRHCDARGNLAPDAPAHVLDWSEPTAIERAKREFGFDRKGTAA